MLSSFNGALPNEILVHIFEQEALEDIEKYSPLPVFSDTVSHAYRRSRDIPLTSLALWTLDLLHPLLPPDVTPQSLLGLVIQPRRIWSWEPFDIPACRQQLSRARSLRLEFRDTFYQKDFQLMSTPAPHLTTLIPLFHGSINQLGLLRFVRFALSAGIARVRVCAVIGNVLEGLMPEEEQRSSDDVITLLQAVSSRPRALALNRGSPRGSYAIEYDPYTASDLSVLLPSRTFREDHGPFLRNLANCLASPVLSATLTSLCWGDVDHIAHFLHALPNPTMKLLAKSSKKIDATTAEKDAAADSMPVTPAGLSKDTTSEDAKRRA
ncbi:hypothetical protein BOTBODRAFT_179037 [Botryobasidium botryosum FD-172 SS1]|uniref:Uncharacterized protein n=1 Tax=Botryobasidium botryosum (strain FD-172 SS1) TaxID=930990 RepID=A0A067M160_BOTB1|nr:hypothetical protein BOTBODRAFT_179037 [Botryobasidium botryosum FD-172 SS1]